MCNVWCLCSQGDIAEQEGDSQSQGSTTWLVDPKESKRTISTKYETTIFWADPSSSWPGLTLLPSLLLCAFSLWLSPLQAPYPPPLPFSPAITCVFIWKQHDLQQLTSSLLLAPCSPRPHTLLQSADFINPLLLLPALTLPACFSPLTHLVYFSSRCYLSIGFQL